MNDCISVIVPVYNVENYLRQCVTSIVGQTYNNIEIIIVDDGSTDNSGVICDEYAQKDERIKVVYKENGGLSSARNVALDIATGDYVMFVDGDDWAEPNMCEKAMEMVLMENVELVSFGYRNVFVEKKGRMLDRKTNHVGIVESTEAIRHLILRDEVIYNFVWNKIYKRSLFEGIRFPEGLEFEDNAVTYKLIQRAKRIFVSDAILYNYIIRNNSISNDWFNPKSIADRFTIWSRRLEDIRLMCPENEMAQLMQVANEAVEGLVYLRGKSEYKHIVDDMKAFLSINEKTILKNNASIKMMVYYYAKSLLPIIKVVRKTRDIFC